MPAGALAAIALALLTLDPRDALGWTTIAVGSWVVRWLEVGLVLAIVAVVLLVAARRTRPHDDPRHRPWHTWLAWIAGIAIVVSMLGITLAVAQHRFVVLPASSDSGCRIVVHPEHGEVGIAQPGVAQVAWLGSIEPQDARVDLAAADTVVVTWQGDEAAITIDAPAGGAVTYEGEPIVCDA